MKKPKLALVSNNPNLKTYYVPFTTMQVDYYPVKAISPEQAIIKANDGKFERLEKRLSLVETVSNTVYDGINVDVNEALERNIDHYTLNEQCYDDIFKKG